MRDFHSTLRNTPFLDRMRDESTFVPMGRGQAHHQGDSLNAEMTGVWTARFCDSVLTAEGYRPQGTGRLPITVIEHLRRAGYDIFTCIGSGGRHGMGTYAVGGGMTDVWLKEEPERLRQFNYPRHMSREKLLSGVRNSGKFYAHLFLRETHRPWSQKRRLLALAGVRRTELGMRLRSKLVPAKYRWNETPFCARKAALERPDGLAELRRRGLEKADGIVEEIVEATRDMEDVTCLVYSNHGEVFDHFRYNQPYERVEINGRQMIEGTSHGNYPYEVLYANMQMWRIPGYHAKVMRGIGRSIDIAPTILDLAGIRPDAMDGESMLPHFTDGAFPDRDRYAESPLNGGCVSMVRRDGYKFISTGVLAPGQENTLALRGFSQHGLAVFDLNSDPYEYVNLINTEQGREVLEWAVARHAELSHRRQA